MQQSSRRTRPTEPLLDYIISHDIQTSLAAAPLMALVTLKSLGSVVSACSKRIWRACNAKVFSVAQQSSSSNAPLFELYASRRTSADLPWRTTSYDQRRMARIMNNAVVQRLVGSNSEASIFLPTRVLGGLSIRKKHVS